MGFSSITTYTENACPADGVPICVASCVGSDYKGRKGAQILFYSEYHHIIGTAFFMPVRFVQWGERVGIARFSQGVSVGLVLSGNAIDAECSDSFEHGFYGYNGFRRLLLLVGSIN